MLIAWSILLVVRAVLALRNVTIDDQYGDPHTGEQISYSPSATWTQGSTCHGCGAQPDPSRAYNGTWHDATFYPPGSPFNPSDVGVIRSASVNFNGSALYVFCILTGSGDVPDGNTDMTFKIDGNLAGNFTRAPNGNHQYNYSVPVFAMSNLDQGPHTLTLESGHLGKKALVLLDNIVYTTDQDPVSSSRTQSKLGAGAISGIVIGVLALVGLVGGLIIYHLRRRASRHSDLETNTRPRPLPAMVLRDRALQTSTYVVDNWRTVRSENVASAVQGSQSYMGRVASSPNDGSSSALPPAYTQTAHSSDSPHTGSSGLVIDSQPRKSSNKQ